MMATNEIDVELVPRFDSFDTRVRAVGGNVA